MSNDAPPIEGMRHIGWVVWTDYGPVFQRTVTDEQRTRWAPVYVVNQPKKENPNA